VRSASEGEFVRFVVPHLIDSDSESASGVVAIAYAILDADEEDVARLSELRRLLDWLVAHLPEPGRFSRTTSKGHYRRKTKGLSWFRPTATEAIAVVRELAALVERCGYPVVELRERRIGYVTYEDDQQVVAEPFRETRTR